MRKQTTGFGQQGRKLKKRKVLVVFSEKLHQPWTSYLYTSSMGENHTLFWSSHYGQVSVNTATCNPTSPVLDE